MSSRIDYYRVLKVARTATANEIKISYRKLALKYHPDLKAHQSPAAKQEAEETFKVISAAYDVLGDNAKKADYDKSIGNRIASWNPAAVKHTEYHPTGAQTRKPGTGHQYISPEHFNVDMWNAWHYGDNAVPTSAVKQTRSTWWVDPKNKHQQYYRKRFTSDGKVRASSFTEEEMDRVINSDSEYSSADDASANSSGSGRSAGGDAEGSDSQSAAAKAGENLRRRREERLNREKNK